MQMVYLQSVHDVEAGLYRKQPAAFCCCLYFYGKKQKSPEPKKECEAAFTSTHVQVKKVDVSRVCACFGLHRSHVVTHVFETVFRLYK